MVLDLLSANGITFRNYNFYCPDNYSLLALFQNWATGGPNNELNQPQAQFFTDCQNDTLPQVSFITEAPPYDEHPAANIQTGMQMIQSIITAVQQSPAWASTAIRSHTTRGAATSTTSPRRSWTPTDPVSGCPC